MHASISSKSFRAKDIMTTRLVTLAPEMDVFEGIQLLFKHRISGAPVVDRERNLLGVFTEKCCMRVLLDAAYDKLPGNCVQFFMINHYVTIDETADLLTIAETILRTGERRLPVLRSGELVGIVSRRDVLRAANELLKEKKQGSSLLYLSALVEMNKAPIG